MTDEHAAYRERLARIRNTIDLEPVDRIPFVFMGTAFAPRYMDVSMAEFCADPGVRVDVTLAAMDRLGGDFDGINTLPAGRITATLSVAWLSRVAVVDATNVTFCQSVSKTGEPFTGSLSRPSRVVRTTNQCPIGAR